MKPPFVLGATVTIFGAVAVAQGSGNGLIIDTTRPGPVCSRKSKNGDKLHMNYRGTLQSNGAEFDSSYGKTPFIFTLGAGQVIKGWDLGLLDMCIGEGRKLTIPPSLGYGSRDMGSIPPNSVLSKPLLVLSH
jgi:FKBP-type peptidyl-prolyl cis-trans isomerase